MGAGEFPHFQRRSGLIRLARRTDELANPNGLAGRSERNALVMRKLGMVEPFLQSDLAAQTAHEGACSHGFLEVLNGGDIDEVSH